MIITLEQLSQLEKAMTAVFSFFKENAKGTAFLLDVCGLSGNTQAEALEQQRIAGIQLFKSVWFQATTDDTSPVWAVCGLKRVIEIQDFTWLEGLPGNGIEAIHNSVQRIAKRELSRAPMPAFS